MNEHWHEMPVVRGFDSVKEIFETIDGLGYISGSYAAFMAANIDTPILPNDVDIFAVSNDAAEEIMLRLSCGPWTYLSESKVAYSIHSYTHKLSAQIVRPHPAWKTFPDDFMAAFDMDVCRAVLIAPDTVLADENVGQLWAKLLLINDPLRSLKRTMKYHARGVQFLDRELIKLFQAWEMATPERRAEIIGIAQGVADDPTAIIHPQESSSDGWDYDEDDYYRGE